MICARRSWRPRTRKRVEDLYLPYKPKKRTPAADAREKGLGELALAIWNRDPAVANLSEVLAGMVNPEKGLNSPEEVLAGTKLILIEMIAETADVRAPVRFALWESGRIVSRKAEPPEPEAAPPERPSEPPPAPRAGCSPLSRSRGQPAPSYRRGASAAVPRARRQAAPPARTRRPRTLRRSRRNTSSTRRKAKSTAITSTLQKDCEPSRRIGFSPSIAARRNTSFRRSSTGTSTT